MEQIDPSLLLLDRNVRRDAAPDKTLVESVRDLGVLVPIVAVRTEGGIRVRYGHRRTHAAIQAGQATVPVWVFDTTTPTVTPTGSSPNGQRTNTAPP